MNKTALLMIVFGLTLQAAADERAAPIAQKCSEEDRDVRSVSRQQPYYPHSAIDVLPDRRGSRRVHDRSPGNPA